MSSVQLLDKTRKINKLLHNNSSRKIIFDDICEVLSKVMDSDVLVISKKGKVLGVGRNGHTPGITELLSWHPGEYVDELFNERLLNVLSTKENVNLETLGFGADNVKKYQAVISPVDIAGERLGTLFIYKDNDVYGIDDIIISEYGTTVVGLEMVRAVDEEKAEDIRNRQIVRSAVGTLSLSEKEAVVHILNELSNREGTLVASRIADRVGITRSVIVNALRKLESAGIIETRSSGMKGTYIKILNEVVIEEIQFHK